jgi:hypothetical protein
MQAFTALHRVSNDIRPTGLLDLIILGKTTLTPTQVIWIDNHPFGVLIFHHDIIELSGTVILRWGTFAAVIAVFLYVFPNFINRDQFWA